MSALHLAVPKDRLVEMTLVVRIDRHIDDDLELIIREVLAAEGITVRELSRLGMTGTIDLPRVWLPTKPDENTPVQRLEEDEPTQPQKRPWWKKR